MNFNQLVFRNVIRNGRDYLTYFFSSLFLYVNDVRVLRSGQAGVQKAPQPVDQGLLARLVRPHQVIAITGAHGGFPGQHQLPGGQRILAQRQVAHRNAVSSHGGGIALLQRVEHLAVAQVHRLWMAGFFQPAPPVAPIRRGVQQRLPGQ